MLVRGLWVPGAQVAQGLHVRPPRDWSHDSLATNMSETQLSSPASVPAIRPKVEINSARASSRKYLSDARPAEHTFDPGSADIFFNGGSVETQASLSRQSAPPPELAPIYVERQQTGVSSLASPRLATSVLSPSRQQTGQSVSSTPRTATSIVSPLRNDFKTVAVDGIVDAHKKEDPVRVVCVDDALPVTRTYMRKGVVPEPHEYELMTKIVMRAALRLGLRLNPSELNRIANTLSDFGFCTRKSLSGLSEELALELKVPTNLAAFLQIDSVACPDWTKRGPLPAPLETSASPENSVNEVWVPKGVAYAHCDPASVAHGFAERGGSVSMTDPHGGFPTQLRNYVPTSPPSPRSCANLESLSKNSPPASPSRSLSKCSTTTPYDRSQRRSKSRSVSPSEVRAYNAHLMRQTSGRAVKSHSFHEIRVSCQRQEKAPNAWMETTFNNRSPRVSIPKAVRCGIAGMDLPSRAREQTANVAPTLPASGPPLVHAPSLVTIRRRTLPASWSLADIEKQRASHATPR